MKVLILGASGIIGQSMSLDIPAGVHPLFVCRTSVLSGFLRIDLTDRNALRALVESNRPDVIVNLAGESRPDVVEQDPEQFEFINAGLPAWLALWCESRESSLVQISTQAVFSGTHAPYQPYSMRLPVNEYGHQKARADDCHLNRHHVTVIRPTFVLGVRPYPQIGRANPVELMLGGQRQQVSDRWLSPSFAPDVATVIWDAVLSPPGGVIHAGVPVRVSRYDIARDLGMDVEAVSHDAFPGIAPRPIDTTYAEGAEHTMTYWEGLQDCLFRYRNRVSGFAA